MGGEEASPAACVALLAASLLGHVMAPIIDGRWHSNGHIIGFTVLHSTSHIIGVVQDRCPAMVTVFQGTLPELDTSVPIFLDFILLPSSSIIHA